MLGIAINNNEILAYLFTEKNNIERISRLYYVTMYDPCKSNVTLKVSRFLLSNAFLLGDL